MGSTRLGCSARRGLGHEPPTYSLDPAILLGGGIDFSAGGAAECGDLEVDAMSGDEFETDLSGEIQEERERDFAHDCAMRDMEQGIEVEVEI